MLTGNNTFKDNIYQEGTIILKGSYVSDITISKGAKLKLDQISVRKIDLMNKHSS